MYKSTNSIVEYKLSNLHGVKLLVLLDYNFSIAFFRKTSFLYKITSRNGDLSTNDE